jgi:hypothetical protein
MDTKKALSLCKKIRAATGEAVLISEEVWAFKAEKSYEVTYKLSYFTPTCVIMQFQSLNELLTFVKEKWNV